MIINLLMILMLSLTLEKAFNLRGTYKNIMITIIIFFLILIPCSKSEQISPKRLNGLLQMKM